MAAGFWNYEKLKKGLTGAVTVAAGAVSRAAEVAKDLAEDLTSFQALKSYKLAGHVATAGPGGVWRVFNAVNKKPGAVFPEASVWILEKKSLVDQASRAGRARGFDAFFEQQRRGCTQMLRLKHPGVLKVIEPLEETTGQMVMVTEPVFGSLADLLSGFCDVPSAPEDRAGVLVGQLEAKYGLCGLSETLHFLHHEAKLAHCNLNPGSIIVARDGGWKLAGFEFVSSAAEGFGSAADAKPCFEYTSAQPSPWEEYTLPPLGYTAPELVGGCMASSDVSLTGAADCFSLAALTYQLVAGKQLLPVGSSTGEYRSRLSMLAASALPGIPATLQPLLRGMLSTTPSARPNAAAFAGCQWFQEDMLLRCLKFLDSILQRDNGQKVAFLKDLAGLWQQFEPRLLHTRVLPPVVAEMRHEVVALAALPLVLAIMQTMQPQAFAASGILPTLRPVFEHADGEVLLALVRHLGVFYALVPSEAHTTVLVPLMLRAFESPNTRVQEELLKALNRLAPEMPYSLLRETLMPRVIGMCLRTTSLVVRVTALSLMAQAAHRLDREAAGAMLDVCAQIVAVDRSAGTAMAVLKLGEAIGSHYGPDVTALRVLPLLCPLLMCPGLSGAQFGTFHGAITRLLDKVAEKRGGELSATAAGTAGGAVAAPGAGAPPAPAQAPVSRASGGLGSADLAGGLFAAGSGAATGSPAAGGGSGGAAKAAWDVPVASSRPPAAEPWSSAAWSSSSSSIGSAAAGSTSASWQSQPQQQQQQQQQPVRQQPMRPQPAAALLGASGMPAPDIFSSAAPSSNGHVAGGDPFAALGPGAGGAAWPLSGAAPPSQQQAGGSSTADLFGGLSLSPQGGIGMQQQARPPALRPPPSAGGKSISLLGSGGSGDPFAVAAPSSGVGSSSAAAFDPFSTLAGSSAGPAATLAGGDAFAGLASSLGAGGSQSMAAARQQQQQQQQQWGGGGGSLI